MNHTQRGGTNSHSIPIDTLETNRDRRHYFPRAWNQNKGVKCATQKDEGAGRYFTGALSIGLEVKSDLSRQRARRDVVCSAEGGEKVVQRHLVGQVDRREAQAPLVALGAEEVVVPKAKIK
jgi:hypothetical protein